MQQEGEMEPRWKTFECNASADLTENLRASLKTFVQLYDQRKDDLQGAYELFVRAAAQANKSQEVLEDCLAQTLFIVFGGALGTLIGGVTGGIWGSLGAVGATTYARFFGNINVAGAAVGIGGSVMGGVVGGVFSGFIGGSAEVAVLTTGREIHGMVSNALWFAIGFATGGAIGSTLGGSVGAVGGAVGGGFGAWHATRATVYLVGKVTDLSKKDLKGKQMKKTDTVQKSGADFSACIKPLVNELKTVQRICDQMASDETVKGVADQIVKTLTTVTEMEKSVSNSQTEFRSCVKEAGSQCKKVQEELQRMREEVEKLLGSL